jgi:hypothetical protein
VVFFATVINKKPPPATELSNAALKFEVNLRVYNFLNW